MGKRGIGVNPTTPLDESNATYSISAAKDTQLIVHKTASGVVGLIFCKIQILLCIHWGKVKES
jgi:hypothetical protein